MKQKLVNVIVKYPLLSFFGLAYMITWLGSAFYLVLLSKPGSVSPILVNVPGVIWYYGPCLSALVVTRAAGGKDNLRGLGKRLLQWRVGWRWYAFIVLYPLGLHLAVVYLGHLLGGPTPVFFGAVEGVPQGNPWIILLGLVVFQILVRGMGEETGWRGFALPQLQSRWGSLPASLILGLLWALWHVHPANFKGLLSLNGVFILANITLTAVIFTWVYNHTGGSVFMAILFHMTLNVVEFVVPIGLLSASLTRYTLQMVLIALFVLGLVLVSGSRLGEDGLQKGGLAYGNPV